MRSCLFQLKFRQWMFAPTVLMTVLAIIFFILFCVLGQWQLQRADLKRSIANRYQTQLAQDYQTLRLNRQLDESYRYKKIRLKGRYRDQLYFLVDNQINQGRAGYHILTPFLMGQGQRAILVNRGWVAVGQSRSALPDIRVPRVGNEVEGILTIPSNEGYRLGEVIIANSWPQRIPFIDIEKMQQAFEFELVPYVLWLSPEVDDYYVREWHPIWSPPEKSEAYALQWFSFAFIVLVLYFALNIKNMGKEEVND